MSRMAELYMEIRDELYAGKLPGVIAYQLNVPIEWVIEIEEHVMCEEEQLRNQFAYDEVHND